jgi:predicted secreted protein
VDENFELLFTYCVLQQGKPDTHSIVFVDVSKSPSFRTSSNTHTAEFFSRRVDRPSTRGVKWRARRVEERI